MPGCPGLCRLARLSLLLGTLSLWGTAACGPAPSATLPAPQLPIQVAYRPALQPGLARLEACAAHDPGIAIYAQPDVRALPEIQADLILYLGDEGLASTNYTATQVGQESLVVVVNTANPLGRLDLAALQGIYTGAASAWQADDPATAIRVWTYAALEGPRHVFENIVLANTSLTSQAYLAANPQAMLEAIAADVNAIGYLPGSWLQAGAPALVENIHAVQMAETLASQMRLPVLAITPGAPPERLEILLLCWQGTD